MAENDEERLTRADLHELVVSIDGLAASIGTMASKQELRSVQRHVLWATAFRVVGGLVALWVIFSGLSSLTDLARQNRQNGRILVECTTPGDPGSKNPEDHVHECFDRGTASQAQAILRVIDTDSNGKPDTQEIESILRQIAGLPPKPTTTVPTTTVPSHS